MNIIDVNAYEQYKKDTLEYALMVNRVRAVPAAKDGLKTVLRRILTTMTFDVPECKTRHVKSTQIYGVVMAKYHPKQNWGIL